MDGTAALPSPAERAETVSLLESSRDHLLALCRGLHPEDWARSDCAGRWTVAHVLEHLVIIDQRVAANLERMLGQPAEPDWHAKTAAADAALAATAVVVQPLNAPAPIQPQGGQSPEKLLADFEAARAKLLDVARNAALALKEHTANHPILGPLHGQQWLRVTAHHTERHLTQMRACLAQK